MIELTLHTILIGSFLGMALLFFRKLPLLVKLPETTPISKAYIALKFKESVKKLPGADKFDYEMYLQKLLSKIRILTLKTESTTESWLAKLRQKAIRKNGHHSDDYWEELKKTTPTPKGRGSDRSVGE